jgi:3-hydroxyisobutyrate dehydrogenase-like beta-hydroxyacid dehydrogenase
MLRRDFSPGFKIRLQQKDLRLALESAREHHLPLPGLALVHQLFAAVESGGCGEEGTQALLKALETLGNVRVKGEPPPT